MTDDLGDDVDALEEEIERLESRLEWLESQTADDIVGDDEDVDESVVRGGLKIRRRSVKEQLEARRQKREELTNGGEDE